MYDFRVSTNDSAGKALRAWLAAGLDKKRGKTQTGLADALGVSQPRISEMLNRKRRFQIDEIAKIAEYIEQPPPPEWLHSDNGKVDPSLGKKTEIRFGLHENPSLVWVFIFRDNKLVDQFEADADDLDNLRRQVARAIQSLIRPK
jgi:transcriptional regulator with XRE-family HTH domain